MVEGDTQLRPPWQVAGSETDFSIAHPEPGERTRRDCEGAVLFSFTVMARMLAAVFASVVMLERQTIVSLYRHPSYQREWGEGNLYDGHS